MKLYFVVDDVIFYDYFLDSVIVIIIIINSNKRVWFKENLRCVLFFYYMIYLCIIVCGFEEYVECCIFLICK